MTDEVPCPKCDALRAERDALRAACDALLRVCWPTTEKEPGSETVEAREFARAWREFRAALAAKEE